MDPKGHTTAELIVKLWAVRNDEKALRALGYSGADAQSLFKSFPKLVPSK